MPAPDVLNRDRLGFDVIDAEYSATLDAIVMVSSCPSSALHLRDLATGQTYTVALCKVPTSVSIGPGGTDAAVGHDALISYVDLAALRQASLPAPQLLDVSAKVFDIVLARNGYVHAFPLVDQWVNVHSVEIATNTETLGFGITRERTQARLHPAGDWMYAANNGLSPDDIEKYDISAGVSSRLYDSPYHGDYGMCGNLWLSPDGTRIYTACGNVFRASAVQAQDMVYAGSLELSQSQSFGYRAVSINESLQPGEVVVLEEDSYYCSSFGDPYCCYTRIGVYENGFLNRQALYSLPPLSVAGNDYAQRGLFVFHGGANGSRRFIVSRLAGMPDPATEYYLTEIR